MGLNIPPLGPDPTPESEQNGKPKRSENPFFGNTLLQGRLVTPLAALDGPRTDAPGKGMGYS
jgi:hypothetical protein